MNDTLEVWLDADFVDAEVRIGFLTHDRGAIRFAYDPPWIQHALSFSIDPDLSLGEGAFHPKPEQANFRVFDDSPPGDGGRAKRSDIEESWDVGHPERSANHTDDGRFLISPSDL